jgi:putative addiction module killer protein
LAGGAERQIRARSHPGAHRPLGSGKFGDAKHLKAGVSELRLDFGPGYRLYFTRRGKSIVILLCAGDKSSQTGDIHRAKQIAAEFEE